MEFNRIDIESRDNVLFLLLVIMFLIKKIIHGISKLILFYGTMFHRACVSGNFELVKYLIGLGVIDLTTKDNIFFYICS